MPMKRGLLLLGVVALGLGGCTTMRGAPPNVLEESDSKLLVSQSGSLKSLVKREEIIQHYILYAAKKKAFRNRVIDHYMGEIDRHYERYSQRLFNEGVQTALGFDAAIIGLASTAALFESASDDLATAISAFAGTQAAIDKNLYFDRTLPALIATMDASRAEIEKELVRRKGQSESDYSLEAAIRDVRRYQQAGTLMRAITNVTEQASTNKAQAEREARLAYEAQLGYSCAVDSEDAAAVERFNKRLQGLSEFYYKIFERADAGDSSAQIELRNLAAILKSTQTGTPERVIEGIENAVDQNICSTAQLDEIANQIQQKFGERI